MDIRGGLDVTIYAFNGLLLLLNKFESPEGGVVVTFGGHGEVGRSRSRSRSDSKVFVLITSFFVGFLTRRTKENQKERHKEKLYLNSY